MTVWSLSDNSKKARHSWKFTPISCKINARAAAAPPLLSLQIARSLSLLSVPQTTIAVYETLEGVVAIPPGCTLPGADPNKGAFSLRSLCVIAQCHAPRLCAAEAS